MTFSSNSSFFTSFKRSLIKKGGRSESRRWEYPQKGCDLRDLALSLDRRAIAKEGSKESCAGEDKERDRADIEVAAKHKVGDPNGDEVRQDGRGSPPRSPARVRDRTEEEAGCAKDCKGDLATKRSGMGHLLKDCCTRKVKGERDQDRSFNPKERGGQSSRKSVDAISVISHEAILCPRPCGRAQKKEGGCSLLTSQSNLSPAPDRSAKSDEPEGNYGARVMEVRAIAEL